MRLLGFLLMGVLGTTSVVAAASATPQTPSPGGSSLVTNEESAPDGPRVRVSTPNLSLHRSETGTLELRVECLHPVGSRPEPKNCLVYVVHIGGAPRYSAHHYTAFQIEADKKRLFSSSLSSFGTIQEGSNIVEPLVVSLEFPMLKALSTANKVKFVLAGERIRVGKNVLDQIREMINYFNAANGP